MGPRCAPPVASPRPWCGSGIEPHPHHRTVSLVHHSRVLEISLSTRTGPWRNVRRFIALKAGRSSPSLRTHPDRRAAAGPQGKGRPLPLSNPRPTVRRLDASQVCLGRFLLFTDPENADALSGIIGYYRVLSGIIGYNRVWNWICRRPDHEGAQDHTNPGPR